MEGGKRRFPPSLNAVKSEYKIFCEQHGGPIICDDRFAKINFEHCCREFPRRRFEPIIRRRWVTDPVHGIRHWPVMAFAASQYAFLQWRKYKYRRATRRELDSVSLTQALCSLVLPPRLSAEERIHA